MRAPRPLEEKMPRVRSLISIPIIHTQADLGSMADALEKVYIRAHGDQRWKLHHKEVEAFWKNLERRLEGLDLDWPKVRIYQDGLPVCGKERKIVEHIAREGSPNYRLILKLVSKGASLTGTEDPVLLVEEHRSIQQLANIWESNVKGQLSPEASAYRCRLLERRDAFISRRIDSTLLPGETGLLFIGASHSPERYLPANVQFQRLSLLP